MKKFILALGTAVMGSVMLGGGSALADSEKASLLATGNTFCESGQAAVFPATNVGNRDVWVTVQCFDTGEDGDFEGGSEDLVEIPAGESQIVSKLACENVLLGGELVRCTVKGRAKNVAQIRGVLHICDLLVNNDVTILDDCEMTEALLGGSDRRYYDDDDDDDYDDDDDDDHHGLWRDALRNARDSDKDD